MLVGTDCSGIETPLMALDGLVEFEHVFASEIDKKTRLTLLANRAPRHIYNDIRTRTMPPHVDLYIVGFPCQTFSSVGLRAGEADPRGQIFNHVSEYIQTMKPKMFLLENVANLLAINGGRCWQTIQAGLHGYTLHHQILNSKDYGLPQSRKRLYIVGFREDVGCGPLFTFPLKIDEGWRDCSLIPSYTSLVDLFHSVDRVTCTPTEREQENIAVILEKMEGKGRGLDKPIVMNVSQSKAWTRVPPKNVSPCLKTQCLRLLWWFRRRGRVHTSRLTVRDARILQGIPDTFIQNTSNTVAAKQIGNAMSVSVVRFILKRMLEVFKTNKMDVWSVMDIADLDGQSFEFVREWMRSTWGQAFIDDLLSQPPLPTDEDSDIE